MKSIIIALVFVCVWALSSCQKIDVNPQLSTAPAKDIISPINSPNMITGNIPTPVVVKLNAGLRIAGNWTLLSDSTFYSGTLSGTEAINTVYSGQPGDHFNFTVDGKLYIKEANKADTALYTVTPDNKISLSYKTQTDVAVASYTASPDVFKPVKLTDHSVTLVSAVISQGGSKFRTIRLQK